MVGRDAGSPGDVPCQQGSEHRRQGRSGASEIHLVAFGLTFDQARSHEATKLAARRSRAGLGATLDLAEMESRLGLGEDREDAAPDRRPPHRQIGGSVVLKHENKRTQKREQVKPRRSGLP
jgi:hypothetical protein